MLYYLLAVAAPVVLIGNYYVYKWKKIALIKKIAKELLYPCFLLLLPVFMVSITFFHELVMLEDLSIVYNALGFISSCKWDGGL